jgi:hypothetical protein
MGNLYYLIYVNDYIGVEGLFSNGRASIYVTLSIINIYKALKFYAF